MDSYTNQHIFLHLILAYCVEGHLIMVYCVERQSLCFGRCILLHRQEHEQTIIHPIVTLHNSLEILGTWYIVINKILYTP